MNEKSLNFDSCIDIFFNFNLPTNPNNYYETDQQKIDAMSTESTIKRNHEQASFDSFILKQNENRKEMSQQSKREQVLTKGKQYCKKYRQRKKQQFHVLQQQNRYLKSKVQDLSFRLRETELELNKLRHSKDIEYEKFQQIKRLSFLQTQQLLHKLEVNQIQQKTAKQSFQNILAKETQKRIEHLNYLMNQLLENMISDSGIYFMDCMDKQKGVFRKDSQKQFTKLDQQVSDIMKFDRQEQFKTLKHIMNHYMGQGFKTYKQLWKNLYQVYLQILNQWTVIINTWRPLQKKYRSEVTNIQSLQLKIHFQKIKYRRDIRKMRQAWFNDQNYQPINQQSIINSIKKVKSIY